MNNLQDNMSKKVLSNKFIELNEYDLCTYARSRFPAPESSSILLASKVAMIEIGLQFIILSSVWPSSVSLSMNISITTKLSACNFPTSKRGSIKS